MNGSQVSVVVAARNDNYGGNFLHRLQIFRKCLGEFARRYGLSGELVVVEWNPPRDKPSLSHVLRGGGSPGFPTRIIQVPPPIHATLPNSDKIEMFEYMAKNVGLRRARGEFILVTNPDIVYNGPLVEFLSKGNLSANAFYRIDRHDIAGELPLDAPVDEIVRLCGERVVRVRGRYGTLPLRLDVGRNRAVYRGYVQKLRPKNAFRWFKTKFVYRIHTGAPGDFMMMSRDAWLRLGGHPESPTQRHIDTYTCFLAQSSGLHQIHLKSPMKIFHQDHDTSEMAARPATSYETYWNETSQMIRGKAPIITNPDTWGLAGVDLEEALVV